MILKFWLIVGEDESVRVLKRTPMSGTLREGEVAIPITLHVSDEWFHNRATVTMINVPTPERPDASVEAGQPEVGDSPNWNPGEELIANAFERTNDPRASQEAQP